MSILDKESISLWFQNLQLDIIKQIEDADGKSKFIFDYWEREEGGGGRSAVLQNGKIIEKGGVNYSAVYGPTPEFLIKSNQQLKGSEFYATGVSIVLHPANPMVPIIHMNVRYFEAGDHLFWFGGGIDLTPHYIQPEDAQFFHQQLKGVCDQNDESYYVKFKNWADDYFYIPHRKETRGIGGIFFDHLNGNKNELFEFVKSVGNIFAPTYIHLMKKNCDKPYGEREKKWQFLRRGRYVEFNLVYDKGTKFGLETNGRTESILMSLPPHAEWGYNVIPEEGSAEDFTQKNLKKGMNWIKYESI
ncbi:MAG TPA: oxygen-dependent coproporphyrinogen oxidase [Bacteroidia bacterium]|nr:oxygen-dependent coproporphyrinogen oxidase [Bacteroidia bacterium]